MDLKKEEEKKNFLEFNNKVYQETEREYQFFA